MYIYVYISFPFHSKNLRINNLPPPQNNFPPTWWRFDTSSLHSAIHLTGGSGCPQTKDGLVGYFWGGWIGWIGECLKKLIRFTNKLVDKFHHKQPGLISSKLFHLIMNI